MIVMALDHTRDFFGVPGIRRTRARAGAALFFTRWVTHFCAPYFSCSPAPARIFRSARSPSPRSRGFLLTRGLWLIVLELIVVRCLGFQFNIDYRVTMLVVLWALGWSMITLSALVHLPISAITTFGVVLIAGHNLMDGSGSTTIWLILHRPGVRSMAARGVRLVSADSVDRRHGRRLRPGAGLRLAA